jgi:hypothetical protein
MSQRTSRVTLTRISLTLRAGMQDLGFRQKSSAACCHLVENDSAFRCIGSRLANHAGGRRYEGKGKVTNRRRQYLSRSPGYKQSVGMGIPQQPAAGTAAALGAMLGVQTVAWAGRFPRMCSILGHPCRNVRRTATRPGDKPNRLEVGPRGPTSSGVSTTDRAVYCLGRYRHRESPDATDNGPAPFPGLSSRVSGLRTAGC